MTIFDTIINICIISLLILVGIGGLITLCFASWKLYNTYLFPLKKEKRIKKLKKYMDYISSLPYEDKAQVDTEELEKRQKELNELVYQEEPDVIVMYDIEVTKDIKDFIDSLIMVEVNNELRESIALRKKYEILNLDNSVQSISTRVLQGLNPDLFNTKMIWTAEYLMKYVVSQTTTLFIHTMLDWNRSLPSI